MYLKNKWLKLCKIYLWLLEILDIFIYILKYKDIFFCGLYWCERRGYYEKKNLWIILLDFVKYIFFEV